MRPIFLVILLGLTLVACGSKPQDNAPQHHYRFTGKVVALDAKHQTATIDAAAIPNFMEAMSMEYPIQSKADFNTLHVGDKITGTLNVSASGDSYTVSQIHKQTSGK